jgi:hypothetical protein
MIVTSIYVGRGKRRGSPRDRAQAGACSPWNAQTEGGSPCAVAEECGCEGSSSSARGGKENPGLTAAHLVFWLNSC